MADMTTAEMVERCNDAANALSLTAAMSERSFVPSPPASKPWTGWRRRRLRCSHASLTATTRSKRRSGSTCCTTSAALKDAGYGQ